MTICWQRSACQENRARLRVSTYDVHPAQSVLAGKAHVVAVIEYAHALQELLCVRFLPAQPPLLDFRILLLRVLRRCDALSPLAPARLTGGPPTSHRNTFLQRRACLTLLFRGGIRDGGTCSARRSARRSCNNAAVRSEPAVRRSFRSAERRALSMTLSCRQPKLCRRTCPRASTSRAGDASATSVRFVDVGGVTVRFWRRNSAGKLQALPPRFLGRQRQPFRCARGA